MQLFSLGRFLRVSIELWNLGFFANIMTHFNLEQCSDSLVLSSSLWLASCHMLITQKQKHSQGVCVQLSRWIFGVYHAVWLSLGSTYFGIGGFIGLKNRIFVGLYACTTLKNVRKVMTLDPESFQLILNEGSMYFVFPFASLSSSASMSLSRKLIKHVEDDRLGWQQNAAEHTNLPKPLQILPTQGKREKMFLCWHVLLQCQELVTLLVLWRFSFFNINFSAMQDVLPLENIAESDCEIITKVNPGCHW